MSSKLRILPLGGCGEVGKNMTVIEYDDEIILIDAGIMFPMNDMLGVDMIIPDWRYLKGKEKNVRAVLITHGHEDHIGAIGHLMAEIDAPIYGTPLTAAFIKNKLRGNHPSNIDVREIQAGDSFSVGSFLIEPFHVTHSIPDCVGFGITTPVGLIVHTGDYKFDPTPIDNWPTDFDKIKSFGERGVLCLLADSTNSTVKRHTPSEKEITASLDTFFEEAEGRIIIASFASLISRIWQVAQAAKKHGRRLALAGRSMRQNVKIAQQLGYLTLPDGLLIDINEASKLPNHEVVIMATGSQGEPKSALGRLSHGRHPTLSIRDGDTVILSSHIIPGNEETIYRVINNLMRMGANVLYSATSFVHVSGHACQDEMRQMLEMVKPAFFIPVHGELRQLKHHGLIAEELGISRDRIAIVENGTPIDIDEKSITVQERLRGGYTFVQGRTVGQFGFSVIRKRAQLAQAGFLMASLRMSRDGKLMSPPQLIVEGFLNTKRSNILLEGVEEKIRQAADVYKADWKQLPSHIEGAVGRYLYNEVGFSPCIYIVIHEALT